MTPASIKTYGVFWDKQLIDCLAPCLILQIQYVISLAPFSDRFCEQ